MKLLTSLTLLLLTGLAQGFPPAPHHELYGMVRDEQGNPLGSGAIVTLLGEAGKILSGEIDLANVPGVNYTLKIPMDGGTLSGLYQASAMLPAMPFTIKVTIANVDYVPIEVQGGMLQMGDPGQRTKLDLTLGVDSDGDGLPDAWEENVIGAIAGLDDLSDVTPDGDADGDGVSNRIEYIAGTYAFDRRAVFSFEILGVENGLARLRFLAVKGRTYRLFAGVSGDDFQSVSFSLSADGSEGSKIYRANSIHFQDVYVPADVVGGKQLFRLYVD